MTRDARQCGHGDPSLSDSESRAAEAVLTSRVPRSCGIKMMMPRVL